MQTKFIKTYLAVFVATFLLAGFVFAQGDRSPLDSSYLFHLYYDSGQLFADRDFQFKYDVVPEVFVPETFSTQFPFKGEVVNLKGEVAKTFQFDPRQGDSKFMKGKLSVRAPYIPDGQKVNFYDAQGKQLLSIFVSDSSFCNDDGVCNSDTGEDVKTCPADCKSLATPTVTSSPEPTIGGGETSNMIKGIIYLIIGLGLAGGWYGWKWWKGKQEPPITQFPTPPLPPNNGQNTVNQ